MILETRLPKGFATWHGFYKFIMDSDIPKNEVIEIHTPNIKLPSININKMYLPTSKDVLLEEVIYYSMDFIKARCFDER